MVSHQAALLFAKLCNYRGHGICGTALLHADLWLCSGAVVAAAGARLAALCAALTLSLTCLHLASTASGTKRFKLLCKIIKYKKKHFTLTFRLAQRLWNYAVQCCDPLSLRFLLSGPVQNCRTPRWVDHVFMFSCDFRICIKKFPVCRILGNDFFSPTPVVFAFLWPAAEWAIVAWLRVCPEICLSPLIK